MPGALSTIAQEMQRRTEAWAEALAQSGRVGELATREALEGRLGRWIEGRLIRHYSMDESVAEEVLADVVRRFEQTPAEQMTSPYGLLCRIIRSKAIDRIRHEGARIPDGGFVDIDDTGDDGNGAIELGGGVETLDEVARRQLQDCVRRMLKEFEAEKPKYAWLLGLCLDELSNDEIACIVFQIDADALSETHRKRIKQRLFEARKLSLPYMKRCHG